MNMYNIVFRSNEGQEYTSNFMIEANSPESAMTKTGTWLMTLEPSVQYYFDRGGMIIKATLIHKNIYGVVIPPR